MTKKSIAFASHVALIDGKEYDGIGNVVKETLNNLVDEYIFVRHSMDGRLPSEVQYYKNGNKDKAIKMGVFASPAPLRYITEVYKTISFFSKRASVDVYVGIDPLNALAGVMLKRRGKIKKVVFYTADYAPVRFKNELLNRMYHAIDRYCVKNADEVWSVSTRIYSIRQQMRLSDEKNIFVPNVPPDSTTVKDVNGHDRYELITTGIIDKQLDFEGAIRTVANMSKEFPELHLTVVGNGPEEDYLKKVAEELGVAEKVKFTGRLPLKDALHAQSTAGIGLALYTGVWGFNEYGDSTKCREYFSFGLPVISTDTHSTVDDIRKWNAGIIVEQKQEDYEQAIRRVLSDYTMYSSNSLKAHGQFAGIHRRVLSKLLK